jgi:hypothetical protein
MTTDVDRAAMQLAIDKARADPFRTEQIVGKLIAEGFEETGEFAAYVCQCDSLHLPPWELPPCCIDDPDNPEDDGPWHWGEKKAAKLLKQMLALGISKYHPDPPAAIKAAKR